MNPKKKLSAEASKLRRRAETRVGERSPKTDTSPTTPDPLRLVHELEVHRVELEMQNEELHRARNEMEAGLEKYGDLFDFAPVAYLTLDQEGTIHEANLSSASLLRIDRSRLVTRWFGRSVTEADRPAFNDFLSRVFASELREMCEVTLGLDGKGTVEVRIEAARASAGSLCRVVLIDLTAAKRAEADRLILSKLESTGILAGGIAHDFNNLLTVILLDLDLARLGVSAKSEVAGLLEDAKQGVSRAQALTAQLITFADGGAPVRKPVHVSELVRESVRLAVDGSRLKTSFALADDLWRVEVDNSQFAQVIRNLVSNARDAMPDGGEIAVRLDNVVVDAPKKVTLPAGRYVRFSITDQGGGVPADVRPKIFDPYFSTKQRGQQKGMGLGLTICHAVVQKHGGAIGVASAPGEGTTFEIYLPAFEPGSDGANASRAQPPPLTDRFRNFPET